MQAVTTVAAKPGEVIILWATGFGPTMPAAPLGVAVPVTGGYPTASSPAVTIDNAPVLVYGAALAPGSAGLYQIAIQVPTTLADGDWPIQVSIGGALWPTGDCPFDSALSDKGNHDSATRRLLFLGRASHHTPLSVSLNPRSN